MPGFVKPTRKVVNIEDAFGELIGKKLIKDLHDNEEICPVCHGTGLRIEDNPYGLSDDPDKRAGQFPYKHQSIQFCPNCYNGVVRFCPDCGKQIPRYRTLCDCDAVVQRRQQEENRKEKERLEKAEKHEPNALGSLFTMAQSDFYSHNEGYFSCWEDFFDSWNEDREEFTEKPLYVWGTEEVEMSFDASSIVSNACEDMYEDAYDDIGADAVAEMQRYLNEWKEKYGRTSYLLTTKHATFIVTTRVDTNPDPFWDRWIAAITYAPLTLFIGWLLHFFM